MLQEILRFHPSSSVLRSQLLDAIYDYEDTGQLEGICRLIPALTALPQSLWHRNAIRTDNFQRALEGAAEALAQEWALADLVRLLPVLSQKTLEVVTAHCSHGQWREGYWRLKKLLTPGHKLRLPLWEAYWMYDPPMVQIEDAEEANSSLALTAQIAKTQKYPRSDLERFLKLCHHRFPPLDEYWSVDEAMPKAGQSNSSALS